MAPHPSFKLQFHRRDVQKYANAYSYDNACERDVEGTISLSVRGQQFYTKKQFMDVCYWKSPRTQKWCASNDGSTVEIITRAALTSADERVRIQTLTTLSGVSWPTASVLLHFGHTDPYPILDYRALWSLGVDPPPPYEFELWRRYVEFCRELSTKCRVSIRTLDKALWQHSRDNQP